MELSWLITAVLGILIIYSFYWLTKSNREYWENQGVTYVYSPPLVGILKDLLLMRKGMGDIFKEVYWNHEGKKFVGFFQFITPTLMIRDPELVNKILVKDFSHFEDRGPPVKSPRDLFSLAFGNLTGDEWRNIRHKLTPTFTSAKMKAMFHSMKQCSEEVVERLKEKTHEELEVRAVLSKYVLNVIGNIAFGLKINTMDENEEKSMKFFKYSTLFFKPSLTLLLKFMLSLSAPKIRDIFKFKLTDEEVNNFFIKLTDDIVKHRESLNEKRNDFLQIMLDLKKKEQESLNNVIKSNDLSIQTEEPLDSEDKELFDQLKNAPLRSENSTNSVIFTDEFIAAQTFIFISGGSETVAAALSFVMFELAQNQELQRKVQKEIDDVLSGHELNYESVKKLTYMEQFIYESFRLHPGGPSLMRICTKDYKIPDTEVLIKKGNFINIPLCGLHEDPQYFPEPQKFDPDRFKDMDAIPKGAFLPFGGGPRMCIAMRLSILEMKVFLAILLSSFTITLSAKTKLPLKLTKNSFLVSVDGGVWVKFIKRV